MVIVYLNADKNASEFVRNSNDYITSRYYSRLSLPIRRVRTHAHICTRASTVHLCTRYSTVCYAHTLLMYGSDSLQPELYP